MFNTETLVVFWQLVSWLSFPVMGLIVGIVSGLLLRSVGQTIDTNSKKPNELEIGAGIGSVVIVLAGVAAYVFFPQTVAGVNLEDVSIRETTMFLFYVIIAEMVMIRIANGKKKAA